MLLALAGEEGHDEACQVRAEYTAGIEPCGSAGDCRAASSSFVADAGDRWVGDVDGQSIRGRSQVVQGVNVKNCAAVYAMRAWTGSVGGLDYRTVLLTADTTGPLVLLPCLLLHSFTTYGSPKNLILRPRSKDR